MAGKELAGIANADANLFRETTYAFIGEPARSLDDEAIFGLDVPAESRASFARRRRTAAELCDDPRVAAFLKIVEKSALARFGWVRSSTITPWDLLRICRN